jgi:hypothetical protein
LFKFDPLSFSSDAIWIKQTNGSSTTNCGHLGLAFGRSEALFYAFSWFNDSSTITLLDNNCNSYWQYSTLGGNEDYSNMIKYK